MWRTRHLRSKELKTYLRQSVQFFYRGVNKQFDESESEVSYLITHVLDRVIYILSQASSLFYVSTELQSLFLRACQIIVDDWRALSNKLTNPVGTKKKEKLVKLARVRNSESLFQSNVCDLFSLGI